MSRPVLLLLLLLAIGCGPSTAELRTAKAATYTANPTQLFKLAGEAVQNEHYKIADVDAEGLVFMTKPTFYGPEGDLQSQGAEGWVKTDNHSVQVAFVVRVVETDEHKAMVTVTPRTFQLISGSPQPRELKPDDPNLPTFVTGRADALAMAIYEYAKPYLAK
jgi:hypothetical protein